MVVLVGENIEALENVIEDEPHFIMEGIDNHLCALAMITKHFMSKKQKGIIGSQWRKLCWQRGVEKISSTRSKLIANGEDCLDGCDGAGGGVVNGGGVVLGNTLKEMGEGMFGTRLKFRGKGRFLKFKIRYVQSTDQPAPPAPSAGWNHPSILKRTDRLQNAGNRTVLRKIKSSSVCLYENNVEVRLS
ncbi:hypothetical protein Tco_1509971 [Tanacetum coccineum]